MGYPLGRDLGSIFEARFYKKVIMLSKNAIIINQKPHEDSSSWNIYHYHKEAIKNFLNENHLSTILFCSIGVEVYLNDDKRLEEYKMKQRDKWIGLNKQSLSVARDKGLPVNELLDASEIPLLNNPIYCIRRNKILHGDIEGLSMAKDDVNFPEITIMKQKIDDVVLTGYIFEGEIAAYDQLLKFQKFIIKI